MFERAVRISAEPNGGRSVAAREDLHFAHEPATDIGAGSKTIVVTYTKPHLVPLVGVLAVFLWKTFLKRKREDGSKKVYFVRLIFL